MGVGNLKVADPEDFEMSNIQRQAGARLDTIGRNKAEVSAELIYELTHDANIEVYTDGITEENAEEFVEGCDIIADQIEFYEMVPRVALHRAARASDQCQAILSVATAGHGALAYRLTKDSPPLEEVWKMPEVSGTKEEIALSFVESLLPEGVVPAFPSREALARWLLEKRVAPIWGAAPPFCEGVLVEMICNEIIGFPEIAEVPPLPGFAWMNMYNWQSGIVQPGEHEAMEA
jgi:molybdopterin/thiamine biosynthesis adenylyltransferase